jgi:hypothetical protein
MNDATAGLFKEVQSFIIAVGFPIFTALWFMFRTDKRLDKLNDQQAEQIVLLKNIVERKG